MTENNIRTICAFTTVDVDVGTDRSQDLGIPKLQNENFHFMHVCKLGCYVRGGLSRLVIITSVTKMRCNK